MQSAVVAEQGHHLSVSEQGIELARRAVDLARLNLSYCYIIATCNGTVGTKDIHVGQLVNPGQVLVSIVDNGERWVEANYKESPASSPPTMRLFAMLLPSPTKQSFRPARLPRRSRMVIRSARTWQGWA